MSRCQRVSSIHLILNIDFPSVAPAPTVSQTIRLQEAVPAKRVFNQIGLENLKGDLFGGVTAAIVALPMALAFGVASGAGAEAGLYGAVLVGLFAALFGGTPTLISEPIGPMTVVFTAVIMTLMAPDPTTGLPPENGMAMAFTVVMLAGVFQILFGVLKLGRYVTLMPYTVISGLMSGIGFILIIIQLPALLVFASPPGGPRLPPGPARAHYPDSAGGVGPGGPRPGHPLPDAEGLAALRAAPAPGPLCSAPCSRSGC
jgi:hypothetical protein